MSPHNNSNRESSGEVELTDAEYLQKVLAMSEEDLKEAFEAIRSKPQDTFTVPTRLRGNIDHLV